MTPYSLPQSPYETTYKLNPPQPPLFRLLAGTQSEHQRLQGELVGCAHALGYYFDIGRFHNGTRPDVLQRDFRATSLFVGDAKDANNETPNDRATFVRVNGYIVEFNRLLSLGLEGGCIAIATNRWDAAWEWKRALDDMTQAAGIGYKPWGNRLVFRVDWVNVNTWVIYA